MIIIRIIAKFVPYRLIRGVKFFWRLIYSASVANMIFKAGKGMMIIPDAWIEGGKYICIGDNFCARSGLRIEAHDHYQNQHFFPHIAIGNNVNVGENCHIGAIDSVEIGNNVLMGSKVYITDHQHGRTTENELEIKPIERKLYSRGTVVVEDDVWLGDGVAIMPNVRIGHNSVVGANAVVTKDVPPFSIVAGVPAKIIKQINIEETKLKYE